MDMNFEYNEVTEIAKLLLDDKVIYIQLIQFGEWAAW